MYRSELKSSSNWCVMHAHVHCANIARYSHTHACIRCRLPVSIIARQTRARDRFSLDGLVTSHYPTTTVPCQSADGCYHGNGRRSRRLSARSGPACVFIAHNNYKTNHHFGFFPLANHLLPDMFITFRLPSITPL